MGEDVRQHRQTRRIAWSAATALLLLAISTSIAAYVAVQQRQLAEQRAKVAFSRQLAAQAVQKLADSLDLALLLGVEACEASSTVEARGALLAALQHSPLLRSFLSHHTNRVASLPSRVVSVAFSPDGKTLACTGPYSCVLL